MSSPSSSKFDSAVYYEFYYAIHTMMTLISPGMNIGYSAVALPLLTKNDTSEGSDAILYGNETAATWFASIVGISGPFGCLLGTFCMRTGRKIPMVITGFACAAGWLIISVSYGVEQILIGRFIVGVGTGLVSAPTVVYIAEISTPRHRLGLINGTSVSVAVGILIIYVLGFFIQNWRMQAAISTIIPLLSASSILLFLPESPIWLLYNNQESMAKQSLMKLRGLKKETPELNAEFTQMQNDCLKKFKECEIQTMSFELYGKNPTEDQVTSGIHRRIQKIWWIMLLPEVWKPFLILNALFFLQQFCGICVIVAYSVNFVTEVGLSADPFLITAVIGVMQLLAGVLLVATSYRLGVRSISLLSTVGMAISLGVLGIYLQFIKPNDLHDTYQPVAIVCIFIFVAAGSYGLIAVPWSMVGELYPTKYVHYLAPLTTCMANIFNFTTLHIYPLLLVNGVLSTVYIYCAVSIIATIFIALALPETQGVPHHDIVARFRKK
ncbi:sugar transporter ERD6-like 2 [Diachasma alloeum]|uniref:sugar transporter ERD6-like 2 n=1 Tax=Diachasma alloeum TaxID=454923 RepID=UPI0007381695|nr:sugar transporter ERD6-like 2 [Diachasma alloeum]